MRAHLVTLAWLGSLLSACSLSTRDYTACAQTSDCVSGYVCVEQLCVDEDKLSPVDGDAGDDAQVSDAAESDAAMSDAATGDAATPAMNDDDAGSSPPPSDGGSTEPEPPQTCGEPLYVAAASKAIKPDGRAWSTAFRDLQQALALVDEQLASCGGRVELWIAKGRYLPTGDGDRKKSFWPCGRVSLYGGFAGTETTRDARDFQKNLTILSGDLAGDDVAGNYDDNSYPVVALGQDVTGQAPCSASAQTVVLDGLVIASGMANVPFQLDHSGAIRIGESTPELRNLVVVDSGGHRGAIACGGTGAPTLDNVVVANTRMGAAISGYDCPYQIDDTITAGTADGEAFYWLETGGPGAQPSLRNMVVAGNRTTQGGTFRTDNPQLGHITLSHVTMAGNESRDGWVGMASGYSFRNSIYWGTYGYGPATASTASSCVREEFSGTNVDCQIQNPFRSYGALTGTWSSVAYDVASLQTILRDDTADWEPGALAKLLVQPDTQNDPRWAIIASNTATELRVWGDVRSFVAAADKYALYDLRPASGAAVIDRGDPAVVVAKDLVGQARVDTPGTGVDPSLADLGAYELTPAIEAICLANCP